MAESPAPDRSVVIAILTFRRPDDLQVALPAFLAQAEAVADADVSLLVVDNDPDGSAGPYVLGLADRRVRYVVEPTPGIAAGRNRALDESPDADLLVFVDDDERPSEQWLSTMLATYEATGATCVVGRVVSEFAGEPDRWLAAGRFFDRRRLPTGTPVTVAATNNLLIDLHQLRRHGVRFDEAFGLSGGSDTLFTRDLARRGATLVWCDEAVVVDMVPTSRITRSWVLHRARRSGNTTSRVAVALAGSGPRRALVRARYVARGAVRVLGGYGRRVVGLVTRSMWHEARGLRTAERGIGMIYGAVGRVVYEYRRT